MPQRIGFYTLFQQLPNGNLTPNYIININGVVIGPGVSIGPGVPIGGLDLFRILGRELSVEFQNGVYFIRGYFGPPVIF